MDLSLIAYIVAIVAFAIVAFTDRSVLAAGLAFFTAAHIL